jgi:ubiquitin-activating enzyme E1 C
MQWIYQKALERAQAYGIEGVTYFLTLGVVKNIIPAVASTNATIAAACCNEAVKLITYGAQTLNCNYMIMGNEGFYTSTFEYERKPECMVCSSSALAQKLYVPGTLTLQALLNRLKSDQQYQLKDPSASVSIGSGALRTTKNLYLSKPPALKKATEGNLSLSLEQLGLQHGAFLGITDAALFMPLSIELEIS